MIRRIKNSYRLNWLKREVKNSDNKQAVASIWKFRFVLLLNLIPWLFRLFPIKLRLKKGGIFQVTDMMTLYIYKEIFVDHCYDYPSLQSKKPTIIDVGSNTGLFVIRMKQLYPNALIYCFEPLPSNYKLLRENLALSQLSGYKLFQKGMGGNKRKEKLFINHENIGGHSIVQCLAGSNDCVDIELIDLESVLSGVAGNRCDLLKLDCEGAEHEIIRSIDKKMAARINSIIFETHSGYDVKELFKYLGDIGYNVSMDENLHLVTAIFDPERSCNIS